MTTETAFDGMTEDELAAMAELDAQLEDSGEDDEEVFTGDPSAEEAAKADREAQGLDDEEDDYTDGETYEHEGNDGKTDADAGATDANDDATGSDADADATTSATEDQTPPVEQPPVQADEVSVLADQHRAANARLAEIIEAKKQLSVQMDDYEITGTEFQLKLDELNREERKLERSVEKIEDRYEAIQQNARREESQRLDTIKGFLSEHGIPFDESDLRYGALNSAVMLVASRPENAHKGAREILEAAHALCVEQNVLQPKAAPKGKPAPKPVEAPPTLGGLPSSAVTETSDGSRFAFLANITDPDAREKAFARLSTDDQMAALEAGF